MSSIIVDIHTLKHVIELCPLLPGLLLILVRPQTISVCSVLPTLHSPQIPWGGFQEPALEQFVVLKYESIIRPLFPNIEHPPQIPKNHFWVNFHVTCKSQLPVC